MADVIIYVFLYIALFFEVFLLLIFIEKRDDILRRTTVRQDKQSSHTLPYASIIVPIFNEEHTVSHTLDSLLALSYPKDKLDIIVVNDGSTDNTIHTLAAYEHHPHIRVFSKINGGKHTALNYGLTQARGSIIGCLDADSYVAPDALHHIAHAFNTNTDAMAVISAIKIHNPRTIVQHIQSAEYMFGVFLRKILSLIGSVFVTPGPFSFFRKDVFEKIGPYRHAHNTEDLEICLRMQRHHMKIINTHNAVVSTTSPHTVKKLYKQRVRWTYGFLLNIKDYYRTLFWKPSYGHLGLFILPMGTFSIYSSIYFAGTFISSGVERIATQINNHLAAGWYIHMPQLWNFDWFFINTGTEMWLGLIMVLATLFMMAIGFYMTNGKVTFTRGVVYCLLFYVFLAPIWLTSSAWKALRAQKPSWR